jgi:hypothetical protein
MVPDEEERAATKANFLGRAAQITEREIEVWPTRNGPTCPLTRSCIKLSFIDFNATL